MAVLNLIVDMFCTSREFFHHMSIASLTLQTGPLDVEEIQGREATPSRTHMLVVFLCDESLIR